MERSHRVVMNTQEMQLAIEQLAKQIRQAAALTVREQELCWVGIRRKGVPLAQRLAAIYQADSLKSCLGYLDIGLYRDDTATVGPWIGPTEIPFSLTDRTIILVDDVLFTGRTVRAALDELMDLGRPRRVWLAVLVDRGGRELPIVADFIGQRLECLDNSERVKVHFTEIDGEDFVAIGPN